jgi:hypothetical protein
VFGLKAKNTTLGHRFLSNGLLEISHAQDYEKILIEQGKVIPNFANRQEKIAKDLVNTAGQFNCTYATKSSRGSQLSRRVASRIFLLIREGVFRCPPRMSHSNDANESKIFCIG